MLVKNYLALYIVFISFITFILFGIDKYRAKHNKWRISERTLMSFAILGGSIGAIAGMMMWHHKTLHPKFKYGIPAILIAQIVLLYFFVTSWNTTIL